MRKGRTLRRMPDLVLRDRAPDDEPWAEAMLDREMGGRVQARRGEAHDALSFPGTVAERDGTPVGLLTYRPDQDDWELFLLIALERRCGVGTALVEELRRRAAAAHRCRRIWLVTTNDNIAALAFYQRNGYRMVAVHRGAADGARETLKPSIPLMGENGIAVHDEIEMELVFE